MNRRPAFTLIELLVVIAIIGILVSLLLSAVMKTTLKIEEVKTRNDLSQLGIGIESFKTQYKVEHFPSRIKLCKLATDYNPAQQLDADSLQFLGRLWPRLLGQGANGRPVWNASGGRVDWDGTLNPNGSWILEGQECLVFFLGGIPTGQLNQSTRGCSGFSMNPVDPSSHVKQPTPPPTTVRFFDFLSNRLLLRSDQPTYPFFSYADGYGKTAYAYFSSYKVENGYNRYGTLITNGVSDCERLGVWPYARVGVEPKYMHPNTYQIISAGLDKRHGTGTVHPEGSGPFFQPRNPMYGAGDPGFDDLANFYELLLGIPPS